MGIYTIKRASRSFTALGLASFLVACSADIGNNPGADAPDSAAQYAVSNCETDTLSITDVQAMKVNKFEDLSQADAFPLAEALLNCVGHPDPDIRDGVVFEMLTFILRSELLNPEQISTLKTTLLQSLNTPDANGFTAPFAALILSEVARTDRVSAYLTPEERSEFVTQATDYVTSVEDYRGYSNEDGWRHGVAHGADWLMQLSLNPELVTEDKDKIREAVAAQVMPKGHSYIFGESERLARPILFLAASGAYTEEEWTAWLNTLSAPAPLDNWGEAFSSENDLARLHNLKAFIRVLYINAAVSGNEGVKTLLPGSMAALRRLP